MSVSVSAGWLARCHFYVAAVSKANVACYDRVEVSVTRAPTGLDS
jgi:hypothetical protein